MHVVCFAVALDQLGLEGGAHIPHDLFHAGQVPVGEDPVRELRDEYQVRVHGGNAMLAGAYLGISAHKPMV